jgi:hypothetical protein
MADNIEALIDALSMMKGMRFIVSTKIQFQQNCAICHAPQLGLMKFCRNLSAIAV